MHIIHEGKKSRPNILPPKDFTYGQKKRYDLFYLSIQTTSIKEIINYNFYNEAEREILKSYSNFILERMNVFKLQPSLRHFAPKADQINQAFR